MLGNVFSPRWARARALGVAASPLDFCALNVAVQHRGRSAWVMTEHPRSRVTRTASTLAFGESHLRWEGDALCVSLVERSAPWGRPVRGTLKIRPTFLNDEVVTLDPAADHAWCPRAPSARVEVRLSEPDVRFEGSGYVDANAGARPLEESFTSWNWSRVSHGDEVGIAYDVVMRDGSEHARGLHLDARGRGPSRGLHASRLAPTTFGLSRLVRSESPTPARLVKTLEDGPFYARSLVETGLGGRAVVGMHETVSLTRFASRWVQTLLPFRMRVERA